MIWWFFGKSWAESWNLIEALHPSSPVTLYKTDNHFWEFLITMHFWQPMILPFLAVHHLVLIITIHPELIISTFTPFCPFRARQTKCALQKPISVRPNFLRKVRHLRVGCSWFQHRNCSPAAWIGWGFIRQTRSFSKDVCFVQRLACEQWDSQVNVGNRARKGCSHAQFVLSSFSPAIVRVVGFMSQFRYFSFWFPGCGVRSEEIFLWFCFGCS